MRIRVKLIGSGTQADPYRVPLPTWQLAAEPDIPGMTAIVDILDVTHPFDAATMAALPKTGTVAGPAVTALTVPQTTAWNQYLDKMYTEKTGVFRPVVA